LVALTIAVGRYDSQPASADEITTCSALQANDWQFDKTVATRVYLGDSADSGWVTVPPADFDPEKASNAELVEYGYPERPLLPEAYAQWIDETSLVSPMLPQVFCLNSYAETESPVMAIYTSHNWAGYVAQGVTGSYIGLEADYVQPGYKSTACTGAQMASWIGLGGTQSGTDGLIQMGTVVTSSGIRAWYEYLNTANTNPPVFITGFQVSAKDRLHFYIVRLPSDGYTTFSFLNLSSTTNNFLPVHITTATSYYDGSTAEWIIERPTLSQGGFTPLANYGSISWTNMNVQVPAGTYQTLGSQSVKVVDMVSTQGTLLDNAIGLTSATSGGDSWVACN